MVITYILAGVLSITVLFLMSAILHIHKIQHELEELSKEQHTQNMDIINLMKVKIQHEEMLLQHIEILKYLVEQDPKLKKHQMLFGPMGEA